MSGLNDVFLEEFKSLDKLCRELYDKQHGITHYIEDMKTVSEFSYKNISGWKADLKYLIHIRNIRNKLVHEEGTLNKDICTQKDIDWIRSFHESILKQTDPIATLYQNNKANEQTLGSLNKKNNTKEQKNIQNKEQQGAQIYKQSNAETIQQANEQIEENAKLDISQVILLLVTFIMIIFLVLLCVEIMFS